MNGPMAHSPFLSVVMPAYNEEAGLASSVEAVLAQLRTLGIAAELLVVDDASRDGTGAIAEALAARHAEVRVFHHPHNRGIGGGFLTGVQQARGEWLIMIPADLALDLNDLQRYVAAASGAVGVVVGISSARTDYTLFRRFVSWVNIHLIRVMFGMTLRQFNYICLYQLEVLRHIPINYWRSACFYTEILVKARAAGKRLVEVDIQYLPRRRGRASGANFRFIRATVQDLLAFWLRWRSHREAMWRP